MGLFKKFLGNVFLLGSIVAYGQQEYRESTSGRLNLKAANNPAKLEKGKLSDKLISVEFRRDRKESKENEKLSSTSSLEKASPDHKARKIRAGQQIQKRNKDNFQVIQDF